MTMMMCVPGALLGTVRARSHTGVQQVVSNDAVQVGRSRKDLRRDFANARAVQAERRACAQLLDIVLNEIRVRARRARLAAVQAGLDRSRDL